jgi:hypothetical protein
VDVELPAVPELAGVEAVVGTGVAGAGVVGLLVAAGQTRVRATRLAIAECFVCRKTALTPSRWRVPQPSLPNVYRLARREWSVVDDVARLLGWSRLSR